MDNWTEGLLGVREILLAIVPAMCGIAMPLLLQAIERIDAKYQSIENCSKKNVSIGLLRKY